MGSFQQPAAPVALTLLPSAGCTAIGPIRTFVFSRLRLRVKFIFLMVSVRRRRVLLGSYSVAPRGTAGGDRGETEQPGAVLISFIHSLASLDPMIASDVPLQLKDGQRMTMR